MVTGDLGWAADGWDTVVWVELIESDGRLSTCGCWLYTVQFEGKTENLAETNQWGWSAAELGKRYVDGWR